MGTLSKNIRPDLLFACTGFLILIEGLIVTHSPSDIQLHDAYFVIAYEHIALGFCIIFLFFASVYFAFNKFGRPLKRILGLTHYFTTIMPGLALLIISIFYSSYSPRPYYTGQDDFGQSIFWGNKLNVMGAIAVLIFLLGQLLLPFNIVWTLLKGNASR